ncbi:Maf family protein [Thiobacter aerophilum]|uniref:dTTP/UTP pyrophosphatase n=1 Tax=Thiobacter aerophilum TaxID=3121275 RepID=A0ABV0ECA0_9BURK
MKHAAPLIYLASQSPRRRALLRQLGIPHRVLVPDVNEAPLPRETPEDHVRRLARIKAEVGAMRVLKRRWPPLPVLAADTVVVLGRTLLGKPVDAAEAAAMLARLSGRRHRVLTAVALAFQGKLQLALSDTQVVFRRLAASEIEAYVASGEPLDKAGGYGIQGRAAAFVRRIEGSYSGVMGLPLFETAELLRKIGIRIP